MKKRFLLLLSALLIFVTTFAGCSLQEVGEGIKKAGDLVDVVQNIASDDGISEDKLKEAIKDAITTQFPDIDPGSIIDPGKDGVKVTPEADGNNKTAVIDENGSYNSKDEVALYIHTYNKLPGNYLTKDEARKLGWSGGSVEKYAKGKAIGGDTFSNYQKVLPDKEGRKWTECDIDTIGKNERGAKRICYSNDGLIYYTEDHYETFVCLYGEE